MGMLTQLSPSSGKFVVLCLLAARYGSIWEIPTPDHGARKGDKAPAGRWRIARLFRRGRLPWPLGRRPEPEVWCSSIL